MRMDTPAEEPRVRGPDSELAMSVRALERSLHDGWPITPQIRSHGVQEALALLDDPGSTRYHRLGALRVLAMLDGINARREATASQERSHDLAAATAQLKAALATPEGRAALANLSDQLCKDPQTAQTPNPPTPQSPPSGPTESPPTLSNSPQPPPQTDG